MKAQVPRRPRVRGGVRCKGKVVAKCYGCDRAGLCVAQSDALSVPCQEREQVEGGEEEVGGEDPDGVSIEHCAQCLLPVGTTTGHFLLTGWGGGRGRFLPLSLPRRWRGWPATPTSAPWPRCAMGRHCPGPAWKSMLGFRCWRSPFWW